MKSYINNIILQYAYRAYWEIACCMVYACKILSMSLIEMRSISPEEVNILIEFRRGKFLFQEINSPTSLR